MVCLGGAPSGQSVQSVASARVRSVGVGSGVGSHRDLVSVLVWVEADAEDRLTRGLARDGAQLADEWRQWLDDEAVLHEMAGTADLADLRFRT